MMSFFSHMEESLARCLPEPVREDQEDVRKQSSIGQFLRRAGFAAGEIVLEHDSKGRTITVSFYGTKGNVPKDSVPKDLQRLSVIRWKNAYQEEEAIAVAQQKKAECERSWAATQEAPSAVVTHSQQETIRCEDFKTGRRVFL